MPVGGLLVGVAGAEDGFFVEGAAGELEADGQVVGGEAAGDGYGREAGDVVGAGVLGEGGHGADFLLAGEDALLEQGRRGHGLGGSGEEVDVVEQAACGAVEYGAALLGAEVVGGADEQAGLEAQSDGFVELVAVAGQQVAEGGGRPRTSAWWSRWRRRR